MKVIFMGYMVPLEEMNKYSGLSVAGNKMQYNVINELNKMADVEVRSISIEPYAQFPRDLNIFIKTKKFTYQNIKCVSVGYCNLPIVKQITQIMSVYKEAKKLVCSFQNNQEQVVVLGFNLFPQIGIPMRWLKRKTKQICLLADLPIDDYAERRGLSKLLRKIFDASTRKSIKSCDNYIVLSEYVKKDILCDKNAIVVEGGISDDEINIIEKKKKCNDKIVILFSGALTEYNGIINLIEAMDYVHNKDVELRIYGSGYLQDYVEKAQKKDSRIKYCGRVSNEEMKECQRKADILINPRQINNQISKYTFPSKTFEYLLSKTIVISTNIPSYGSEYLDKMIITDDSSEGLSSAINNVMNMSCEEMEFIQNRAYEFVVKEKKWNVQAEKIFNFINETLKSNCNEREH